MKGRAIARRVVSSPNRDNNNNSTNAALAGGAVGALSGVNNPTITSCSPDDTSFYCRLTRFFNSIQMVLRLVLIVIAVGFGLYFGYTWYKSRK